ncbi:DEAD/DEAH box helicase [Kineosporia babensis]|uniref:DEAD/DEAH box helicase n=1 Tax=Kineosporia babensis TaxID=499548 RepID=A0A9X1NQ02_9ACTN|nr:DEAD/DEAH box helicase [Kineosporia babensis]
MGGAGNKEIRRVLDVVAEQNERVLASYAADPGLIEEHANGERRIAQGGYGDRQIFELVQNGADELRNTQLGAIHVVLTPQNLYCANEGDPVTPEGAESILRLSVSRKRGGQIGRFGVGVKSVLTVTDAPQFFSKDAEGSFGFGFHRAWSRETILQIAPDANEMPVLRMAQILDVDARRAQDPVLNELMSWATTVVRLPLKAEAVARLALDLRQFPAEFLLFSPHVGSVVLEDRSGRAPVTRQIDQKVSGVTTDLQEEQANGDDTTHRWKVFRHRHRPSPDAMKAAGELHNRNEVEIAWAVPAARSRTRGVFWSYFPTKFATTLRGILNAPWKTSEDRQAIFDGNAFNEELLQAAADLVVSSLPMLATDEDPGLYLDYLPGRGREAPQFADERLTAAIYARAAHEPSVIDQDGRFRLPAELRQPPKDLLDEYLKAWAAYPDRPRDWTHPLTEATDRRARVTLIMSRAGREPATVTEWLEALVADENPASSSVAVQMVARMVSTSSPLAAEAVQAKIVLTHSHGLVRPVRGKVFRRQGISDALAEDLVYVHDEIAQAFGLGSALDLLGIREADGAGRLAALLDQGTAGWSDEQWEAFWSLTRSVGVEQLQSLLGRIPSPARARFKVATLAGTFREIGQCLLPGVVVPGSGGPDAALTIDIKHHVADRHVLGLLGALAGPVDAQTPDEEPWFEDYREYAWKAYVAGLDAHEARPQVSTMQVEGAAPAGPLHFLTSLSPEGRAAFLRALPERGLIARWKRQVGRQKGTAAPLPSPLVWMARRHGYLKTEEGVLRVRDCVSPALSRHSAMLPVADVPTPVAEVLSLPARLEDVPARVWEHLLRRAVTSTDDAFVGQAYALTLTGSTYWPEGVATRCRVGEDWSDQFPDDEITVTSDAGEYEELRAERLPALLAPDSDSAARMIEAWGMRSAASVIEKRIQAVDESDPVPILEIFPYLQMKGSLVGRRTLVKCEALQEIKRTPNGERSEDRPYVVQGEVVRVLKPADDDHLLQQLDAALGLGLGDSGRRTVLERKARQAQSDVKRRAMRAESREEKILELVGEEGLKAGLPGGLLESHERRAGRKARPAEVAKLSLDAHGDGLLSRHKKEIVQRMGDAPRSFTGQTNTRRFVAELGLPESFAGLEPPKVPDFEEVEGPTAYPRLYEYQELIAQEMAEVLTRNTPSRAMLRLPTGAGKTRVAVEAAIRVAKQEPLRGPILWIAESEELCEQAVESWKFVWSKVGPPEKLSIARLWGGRDASRVELNPHLVVATDAQLVRRLEQPGYQWLQHPAFVIVDEAHRAISRTYTSILEMLGISHRHTARPLIGLSATPYRTNDDESDPLRKRFGDRLLGKDVFGGKDPYEALREQGILADVEHRQIRGGTVSLSAEQLDQADTFEILPAEVERQLGRDQDRNDALIKEIKGLDKDWQILVFATSVDHARYLAAELNGLGIASGVIDSFTPDGQRRQRIDDYRKRRIRVLTNYGVLAQGFDAPATRAVVIARPTYSPIRYQQMIGRGLRGPRNGGEKECLILDVKDNIENFGKELAFSQFDHLWGNK